MTTCYCCCRACCAWTETQQHREDGDEFDAFAEEWPDEGERFGPFDVRVLRVQYLDVARATVHALWAQAPQRLLRLLGRMSHATGEPATHRSWATTALDVEFERQSFREAQGYVSAAGARAFLAYAAGLTFEQVHAIAEYDVETCRHLARIGIQAGVASPVHEPRADPEHEASSAAESEPISSAGESLGALRALLEEAELLEPVCEQLRLAGPKHSSEPTLTVQLRRLAAEDPASFHERARELAYLANVLKAGVCVQDEVLSDEHAKDAAFAVCNLGAELAPASDDYLQGEPGLIRVFLFGWCVLRLIPQRAVAALRDAAGDLGSWLRDEANVGLGDLQVAVAAANWADAREAAVFLSIAFDTAICRAIGPLLDEIPRYSLLLEGARRPDEARWIASKADLDRIAALLANVAPKRPARPK